MMLNYLFWLGGDIMAFNKKSIFCFLNFVFFCAVAGIVYKNIYHKNEVLYNERCSVYERFSNINKQIDDFSTIKMKIAEQEDFFLEVFSHFSSVLYPNDIIKNSYKTKVFDLLKNMKIDTDVREDMKQINNEENISLDISFFAKYNTFCQFLFELEQFSKIESINYDYKGAVSIKSSPILYSNEVNDCFLGRSSIENMDDLTKSGYFKEIVGRIQKVKDIGHIDTWRDIGHIPKSPFLYYLIEEKKKLKKRRGILKNKNTEKPAIFLDGIMYEKEKPIVIIDGKFYYVGDMYKNARIVKIEQSSIFIDCNGKKYTIKMEQ